MIDKINGFLERRNLKSESSNAKLSGSNIFA